LSNKIIFEKLFKKYQSHFFEEKRDEKLVITGTMLVA